MVAFRSGVRLFQLYLTFHKTFYNHTQAIHLAFPTIIQMLLQVVLSMEGVKYGVNFGKDHLDY